MALPVLLTKKEVAEYLGVCEWTIGQWCREKKIEHIRVGSSIRFREEQVLRYYDSRTVKATFKKTK